MLQHSDRGGSSYLTVMRASLPGACRARKTLCDGTALEEKTLASRTCHPMLVCYAPLAGTEPMQIVTSDSEKSIARVALKGKLDIAGAEIVALPLATLAGAKQGMIIDMGE